MYFLAFMNFFNEDKSRVESNRVKGGQHLEVDGLI